MKLLATIRDQDFNQSAILDDSTHFCLRKASRAVVFDNTKVALLKVGKYNYYKLPGGGIEKGEDKLTALKREIKEELGCEVEVKGEVGKTIEFIGQSKKRQDDYCYLAKVESIGRPDFTDKELAESFEIVWVPSLEDAINLVKNASPSNYEGKFIQRRDSIFLKAVKSSLK